MVNVLKFHNLDIIFINVSYSYLLSSYLFLVYKQGRLYSIGGPGQSNALRPAGIQILMVN